MSELYNGSNLTILGISDVWMIRQDDLQEAFQECYAMGAAEQKDKDAKICESLAERDYCVDVRVAAKAIRSQE